MGGLVIGGRDYFSFGGMLIIDGAVHRFGAYCIRRIVYPKRGRLHVRHVFQYMAEDLAMHVNILKLKILKHRVKKRCEGPGACSNVCSSVMYFHHGRNVQVGCRLA